LRLRSAAMAQLIAGSCPSDAQLDPMARFAANDRQREISGGDRFAAHAIIVARVQFGR
jgi:hypothetical protein